MNEPRDGQPWPELSPPCGLVSFDAAPFGCLRFSSILASFPLSIAFPGWSQPVLDLDRDGFGVADFPGAFSIRRMPLPEGTRGRQAIQAYVFEQFAGPETTSHLDKLDRSFHSHWHRTTIDTALFRSLPHAEVICAIESDQDQTIFFVPQIDRQLWSFQRRRDDLDDSRTKEMLASITWLDPIWFSLLPLLL